MFHMIKELILNGILPVAETAAFMAGIAILILSIKFFRKPGVVSKIIMGIIFGLLAIYGTIRGIKLENAIVNVRDTAPMIAGLVGGPITGIIAGLMGGIQRYFVGGFTAIPCALATIIAGTVAGLLSFRIIKSKHLLLNAMLLVACIELLHMFLILLIGNPFFKAFAIVNEIYIPMIVGNVFGVGLFFFIQERIKSDILRN